MSQIHFLLTDTTAKPLLQFPSQSPRVKSQYPYDTELLVDVHYNEIRNMTDTELAAWFERVFQRTVKLARNLCVGQILPMHMYRDRWNLGWIRASHLHPFTKGDEQMAAYIYFWFVARESLRFETDLQNYFLLLNKGITVRYYVCNK